VSDIAAQVSLYPLRQKRLAPAIEEALQVFQEHGLDVESGALSTVIAGEDGVIFAALQEAFRRAAAQGPAVMTVTFSNTCPVPGKAKEAVTYAPIGHVENAFDEPRAASELRSAESRIVLRPGLAEGLVGLEPGQQVMVVFYFHRSQGYDLKQHPQGDMSRPQRGVFALRSPRRPNPIGITVVDLLAVEGHVLRVRGLDALNGTPVLDLKPA
jgi:tRNA-Thr(GGU) m(6)t(6)A37 methyltransferase TsaA